MTEFEDVLLCSDIDSPSRPERPALGPTRGTVYWAASSTALWNHCSLRAGHIVAEKPGDWLWSSPAVCVWKTNLEIETNRAPLSSPLLPPCWVRRWLTSAHAYTSKVKLHGTSADHGVNWACRSELELQEKHTLIWMVLIRDVRLWYRSL